MSGPVKGEDHSYAPVDVTPAEMQRLMEEMRSEAFVNAHPVIQSAYAHYCFVVIHPFADGNGRVTRALASIFTYRAASMPIMILSEHKEAYLNALEAADDGDYQGFTSFLLARSLDTMELILEQLQTSLVPSAEATADSISALYITRGGYSEEQIDQAGQTLIKLVGDKFESKSESLKHSRITSRFASIGSDDSAQPSDPKYRSLLPTRRIVIVAFDTPAPYQARVERRFEAWLPTNAAGTDDILIRANTDLDFFRARIDEVVPAVSGALLIRIDLFTDRVIRKLLNELKGKMEQMKHPQKVFISD